MKTDDKQIETRAEKINRLWKKAHGIMAPYFLWENYRYMRYGYNEAADTIDCECGISVPIDIPTEELTQKKLVEVIDKLELKVLAEYKRKYNIDLGLKPYCD